MGWMRRGRGGVGQEIQSWIKNILIHPWMYWNTWTYNCPRGLTYLWSSMLRWCLFSCQLCETMLVSNQKIRYIYFLSTCSKIVSVLGYLLVWKITLQKQPWDVSGKGSLFSRARLDTRDNYLTMPPFLQSFIFPPVNYENENALFLYSFTKVPLYYPSAPLLITGLLGYINSSPSSAPPHTHPPLVRHVYKVNYSILCFAFNHV